jgi:hypothetical protein
MLTHHLRITRLSMLGVLVLALLHLPGAAPARAAGVVGTGTPDSCDEEALDDALETGGGVSFNCGPAVHTITTTSAKTINIPTLIDAENKIILDGQGTHRLFVVNTGATIRNIILEDGYVAGSDGGAILHLSTEEELVLTNVIIRDSESTDSGGAIATYGPTNLSDVILENNQALNGGALYARYAGAQVRLYGGALYNNRATGTTSGAGLGGGMLIFEGAAAYVETVHIYSNDAREGGGVYVFPNAALQTWEHTHFQFNLARQNGGGIYAAANATVNLNDTLFTVNMANKDRGLLVNDDVAGGGLWNAGTATLTHVDFNGSAAGEGGGLYNLGQATLTNVTLTNNSAFGSGGGLFNLAGTVTMIQVTFNNNRAFFADGGGVYVGTDGTVGMTDALLINNSGERGGGVYVNGGVALLNRVSFSDNEAELAGGAVYNYFGELSLNNGTISGGSAPAGGGLFSLGTAALNGVTVSDNEAGGEGGGVYNVGTLTLGNVTVSGNEAASDGGGLFNDTDSIALLSNVTLSNNDTGNSGGGLYHRGSSLILTNVTLHDNSADDSGGGLYNETLALLLGVTLSENSAMRGGGLYNEAGTATVDNTTFSGNEASQGGGLYNYGGTTNLTNVTLSGNSASLNGGGIHLDDGTVTAKNSIVANSPSGGNCLGTPTNNGFNLADDTTCGFTLVSSMELGPLTFNGGPTQTHLPLAGSPAINFVSSGCPPLNTDQRGAARPVGAWCDAGAVEFGAVLPMLYLPQVTK